MKEIPHWDVDEDYIVDISNSITIFQRIQATDKELVLASAAPDLLEALQIIQAKMSDFIKLANEVGINDADGFYLAAATDAEEQARAAISKALGEE